MLFTQETPQGITFKVFVQPRSSKNMIVGLHGDALKIKLKAPPVDNAANKMCVKFLAKCLKVPKSALDIVSGQTSRTKMIRLQYDNAKKSTKKEQKDIRQLIVSLSGPPEIS